MCGPYLTKSKNVWILLLVIMVIFVTQQFVLAQDNISRGSLFRIGNDINVKEGEAAKSIFSIGGKVVVEGEVKGNIISFGKLITIGGKVGKNVISIGNDIVLKEGSIVGGDVMSIGGRVLRWADTEVKGEVKEKNIFGFNREFNKNFKNTPFNSRNFFYREYPPLQVYFNRSFKLVSIVISLIIAGLVLVFLPRKMKNIALFISNKPGESLSFGILGIFLLIFLSIFLATSLMGILFIFLMVILIIIIGLVGAVSIDFLIGQRLLTAFKFKDPSNFFCVFSGLILLELILLELIETIPSLAGMIMLVIFLFGFGAVIKTKFGSKII